MEEGRADSKRKPRAPERRARAGTRAAGVQAFEQGDYAAAVRQFQAALPLADAVSLVPSLMNLAAVYYA